MRAHIKKAIEKHAIADYPRECCGVIVADGNKQKYIPCRNIAENNLDFRLSAEDYASAEDVGQVLSIVHSHIDRDAYPSEADKVSCEQTGIPWHIVSIGCDAGDSEPSVRQWHSFEPTGYEAPLVGREFFHGTLDCYGLIRDFYSREMHIEIPDFDREDFWWQRDDAPELYLENFEKAGFYQVNDGPRFGDVVLMQYRSGKTNHGGVYIGNCSLKTQSDLHQVPNALLHHPMPRLSERVVYSGYWQDITRMIVRHKDAQ
jgi:proteasome lid subunit RPN8/RPN11